MRPDLNLLYALQALLEEGSVVGAARRMNLSAPAMSRTLARIRETTGDPIFVQSGRALVPTPRALQLREQIQDALQQASGVLAPGEQVDLKRLDTRFNVRANDIFTGIYEMCIRDRGRGVRDGGPDFRHERIAPECLR